MATTTIDSAFEEEDLLELVKSFCGVYIVPAMATFGFVSNILVIIIMHQPQYRKHVSCFYLRLLAVFDNLALLPYAVALTKGFTPLLINEVGRPFCAVYFFLVYFSPSMAVWLVVAITFIRFVAVVFPLKANSFTSFKTARIFAAFIIVLFAGYGVPGLIYGKAPEGRPALRCVWDLPLENRAQYVLAYTVHVMLAFFCLVVFNTSIFYNMKKRSVEKDLVKSKSHRKDDKAVMIMVMSVTLTFMILQFPWIIHITVWDSIENKGSLSPSLNRLRQFTFYITILCFTINSSINFVLYVVCCRKFRNDFQKLLMCKWSHLQDDLQK